MKSKQVWIKPEIKAKELKLHTLLGENGWLNGSFSVKPVLAKTWNIQ